jgi:hypothetical protein
MAIVLRAVARWRRKQKAKEEVRRRFGAREHGITEVRARKLTSSRLGVDLAFVAVASYEILLRA